MGSDDGTMRAWRTHEYGRPAEVLKLDTVPIPVPEAGEVCVEVHGIPFNLNDLERITRGRSYLFTIAHHLLIRDTPRGSHFGGNVFRSAMAFTIVEVGRNRHVTVVRELPRGFTVPLIPAGQVMDQDHPWIGPGAQGPSQVGVNEVAVGAAHDRGFRQHAFILVCLVHTHPPCFC